MRSIAENDSSWRLTAIAAALASTTCVVQYAPAAGHILFWPAIVPAVALALTAGRPHASRLIALASAGALYAIGLVVSLYEAGFDRTLETGRSAVLLLSIPAVFGCGLSVYLCARGLAAAIRASARRLAAALLATTGVALALGYAALVVWWYVTHLTWTLPG